MSLAFADSLRADGAFPIAAAHPNPLHAGLNAIGNHLVGHCGRGQHDYAIGDGFDIRHASEAALPLNFCSGRIHRNRVIAARAELAKHYSRIVLWLPRDTHERQPLLAQEILYPLHRSHRIGPSSPILGPRPGTKQGLAEGKLKHAPPIPCVPSVGHALACPGPKKF